MKKKHQDSSLARKVKRLKQKCPMNVLLRKLGLGRHARSSCSSPFRSDTNPSWGIFKHSGSYYFKDMATGESGDEITFIAMLKKWDTVKDFRKIVDYYDQISRKPDPVDTNPTLNISDATEHPQPSKPDLNGFQPGSLDQLRRLSQLRSISVPALMIANERGFLIFGTFNSLEVFGIRDSTGCLAELRRLDGLEFPQYGQLQRRKSHTVKGSSKDWPVGIVEAAAYPVVMLVEGLPDFLACFDFIIREGKQSSVAPVAMLTAACSIDVDAVQRFNGKRVRLFPHADQAGINAAVRWNQQLQSGSTVDCFNFSQFDGIKDLCDFNIRLVEYPIYNNEVLP